VINEDTPASNCPAYLEAFPEPGNEACQSLGFRHSEQRTFRDLTTNCCCIVTPRLRKDCLGIVLINLQLFNAGMILPLPLLLIAWYESNRKPIELSILTFSAVLLNLADVRSVKLALFGADYSSRLFATIEVNMLVAIVLGINLGIMRRWIAAVAALILAFAWFLVAAVNSAV
jgi:hypothetical protein